MQDYIKEFCDHHKIRLVYTRNKYTILSAGINKNTPVLRVHILFRRCPYEIARAIEDFYILRREPVHSLEALDMYMKSNHELEEYKIIPPGEQFRSLLKTSEQELIVSRILQKNFFGHSIHIEPNQGILVERDNVLELDITVENGRI